MSWSHLKGAGVISNELESIPVLKIVTGVMTRYNSGYDKEDNPHSLSGLSEICHGNNFSQRTVRNIADDEFIKEHTFCLAARDQLGCTIHLEGCLKGQHPCHCLHNMSGNSLRFFLTGKVPVIL